MTKTTLFLTIASALFVVSCSPAVSVRPLTERGSCVTEPQIEGEWIAPYLDLDSPSRPGAFTRFKVTARSGRYDVEVLATPEDESEKPTVTRYDVCLASRDGILFFDADFVRTVHGDHTTKRDDLALGVIPMHVVGRLRVEPNFLVLQLLDSEWVRKNTSPSFQHDLTLSWGRNVAVITAPSAEVLEFLTRHAEELEAFAWVMHLCRPDTDCVAKAYEHWLSLGQAALTEADRLKVLERLSEHYLQAGQYRQALASLRQLAALKPADASVRNGPATALLFDRDYEAARHEFSSIQAMHPDDASAQERIAWSYFLEGRFEEAGHVLQSLIDAPERHSIEPVLLAYVALQRCGRYSEAKRLLTEESAASFRGPVDEQLLLLLFADRIDSFPYKASKNTEDESRAHFFSAELFLSIGQPDAAREELWECVTLGRKDSLYVVAATIELERMSAPTLP